MKMKEKILLFAAIFGALPSFAPLKAQTGSNNIELPSTFIVKHDRINIRGGRKQAPNKPAALTSKELDSLNSLEKQQTFLLPPKSLPDKVMNDDFSSGFLKGEFGQFLTPSAEAGFGFRAGEDDEYDFYFHGGYEVSDGHVDNAEYSKGFAKIACDYFAPDKFWIFGGSRTHTELYANRIKHDLYSFTEMYGDSLNAPDRSTLNAHFSVDNAGMYEGYKFNVGAAFNLLDMDQDSLSSFDNALSGYLNIKGRAGDFEIGGNLALDLHSVRGRGVRFSQANALMYYFIDAFSLELDAGFQMAQNYMEESVSGLLLDASMEYRAGKLVTLKGGFKTGLENISYKKLTAMNPYISKDAVVDFNNAQLAELYLNFHPSEALSISCGFKYGMNDKSPYFIPDSLGAFNVGYDKTKKTGLVLEADWQPTEQDNIIMNINYDQVEIDSSGKTLPFSYPLNASVKYRRNWGGLFGTQIGIIYIGERYADAANDVKLDSYIDLNARIDFNLSNYISLFGRFDNILNNDIYIWDGYKERDLFIAAGILWRF